MTLELPVFRLGLAGFTASQVDDVHALLKFRIAGRPEWQEAPLTEADAWWVSGNRLLAMADGTLRVGPGMPQARSIHFRPDEMDRPVAIAHPVPPAGVDGFPTFHFEDANEAHAVLDRFTAWLQPVVAQFGLAGSLVKHHATIGGGVFHVTRGSDLLAVVDLRGDVGVLPTACPADFQDVEWIKQPGPVAVPEGFARLSLSELMWQFALRTQRDLLPPHYRTVMLYYRRAPRLPQHWLRDAHLLLLRELAGSCATFGELHSRTGLRPGELARHLAALYMVGSITSNPRRAAAQAIRRTEGTGDSILTTPPSLPPRSPRSDNASTAPAPVTPR
jgi:hypothetical protein